MYGAASAGGRYGCGTLYRVSKNAARFEVVYTFTGGNDGCGPTALVRSPDGALYGTTQRGQGHNGTIFRVGRSGALATLFVFRRAEDGQAPGPLVVGRDGALYGRTEDHAHPREGSAFRFSPDGAFTVLHHFSLQADGLRGFSVGTSPFLAGRDGNLYARTNSLSSYSFTHGGSVFRMTPNGQVTALWHADQELDGPLLQAPDGRLWGSESFGSPFVVSLAGGGHVIETGSYVVVHTIAADGTMYGFQRPSGLSSLKQYRLPERGARIARREERAYWA